MFSRGNFREIVHQRIVLYANRYRQPTYDIDSDNYELDRCDSDDSFCDFGMFSGFRALPFFILKPKLRIEHPRIEIENQGYHNEVKTACFVVHNVGKREACNIRVKIKANMIISIRSIRIRGFSKLKTKWPRWAGWDDFKTLNPDFPRELQPFDLDPDQKALVKICEVHENNRMAIIHCEQDEMPTLDLGQSGQPMTYELLIRFIGRNFLDRKIWRLDLNLSYEDFSLKIRP